MPAINTTPINDLKSVKSLFNAIASYKNSALDAALSSFSVGGSAGGNEVVSIWARSIEFYDDAASIVSAYTDQELTDYWEAITGQSIATLRADLIALGSQIINLLDLIENNQALFLIPSMSRSSGRIEYPSLTAPQRAAVKARLDNIAALIV